MVYRLSVEVARWFRKARWPHGASKLRDRGLRAADSVALHIAEGHMHAAGRGQYHYRIALGSAAEACAVLDLIDLREYGVHTSVDELIACIEEWLEVRNDNPKPLVWTLSADEVLSRVQRFCERLIARQRDIIQPTSDSTH